jgi:hypothetical protein
MGEDLVPWCLSALTGEQPQQHALATPPLLLSSPLTTQFQPLGCTASTDGPRKNLRAQYEGDNSRHKSTTLQPSTALTTTYGFDSSCHCTKGEGLLYTEGPAAVT